ncbi:preprotein translocase subunit YajC [Aquipuribacter sp. MA13-6]|uniref:preprotein translocase subunit YajC n=1 Tax=unclassified Aquipuribacter TaxID=2635084 RepID=UPI003EED00A5
MDPVSLLLVGGLVLILVMQFSRVRKQQQAVKQTQAGLEVGVDVLTAAGMVATVVTVDEATITLRGPDGNLSRWVKGAVVRVLPDTDPASSRYQAPATTDPTDPTGTGTGTTDTGAVDDDGNPRHQD